MFQYLKLKKENRQLKKENVKLEKDVETLNDDINYAKKELRDEKYEWEALEIERKKIQEARHTVFVEVAGEILGKHYNN